MKLPSRSNHPESERLLLFINHTTWEPEASNSSWATTLHFNPSFKTCSVRSQITRMAPQISRSWWTMLLLHWIPVEGAHQRKSPWISATTLEGKVAGLQKLVINVTLAAQYKHHLVLGHQSSRWRKPLSSNVSLLNATTRMALFYKVARTVNGNFLNRHTNIYYGHIDTELII